MIKKLTRKNFHMIGFKIIYINQENYWSNNKENISFICIYRGRNSSHDRRRYQLFV